MDDDKEEMMSAMYGQEPDVEVDEDAPRKQPEQLRLAGKATVITYADKQIAIPKMEYVERLEAVVREQQKLIDEQAAKLKKMEITFNRVMNIANRNISAVESDLKKMQSNRNWDY